MAGGSAWIICNVLDQPFDPLQRLTFPFCIGRHRLVFFLQILVGDMRAREIVDETADAPPANAGVKTRIDVVVDRDRQLLRYRLIPTHQYV